MKILFITSSPLGDAVLTTGLLAHIIETNPDCKITVVCGPLPASIFRSIPEVKQVHILKKKKHHAHWFELWRLLSKTRWDMIVDLRNSIVSRVLPSRKKFRFGPHIDKKLHKVEQNAQIMGVFPPPAPRLWFTDEQEETARKLIPDKAPVLAIGPTANWVAKTWPPGCFIELVSELIKPDGIMPFSKVAIFGAPGEEAQASQIIEHIPEELVINLVGKTDPVTAGAALKRCRLYVGNDSGLMHISAATGVKTAGLFGPSYPDLYRPWGKHCTYARTPEAFDELIDYEGYSPASAPCLMATLEVKPVLEKINELLNI